MAGAKPKTRTSKSNAGNSSTAEAAAGRSPAWAQKQAQDNIDKVRDADYPRLASLPHKVTTCQPDSLPAQEAPEAAHGKTVDHQQSPLLCEEDDEAYHTAADSEAEYVEANEDAKLEHHTGAKEEALGEKNGSGSPAKARVGLDDTTEVNQECDEDGTEESLMEEATGDEEDAEGMTPEDLENDCRERARLVQLKEQALFIRDRMVRGLADDGENCQEAEEQRRPPSMRPPGDFSQKRVDRDGPHDRRPRPYNRKSDPRRERDDRVISRPTEILKPLENSPSSWAAQQRERREASKTPKAQKSDVEVVREMRLILNKLTIEKFDTLYLQLTSCGICSTAHVEILISELFEKATTQHHFIGMYADLCVRLHKWSVENPVSGNDGKVFKRILLNQCQLSFEQNLKPREQVQVLDAEMQLEAELRHKMRMLGNLRFLGALLEKGMLASKVLLTVVEKLLESWTPVTLECLTVFLVAVGPTFDRSDWVYHEQLREVFNQVRQVRTSTDVPARVRFLLQDVLDLQASGWKNEKKAREAIQKPTTLEAVQKQAEEDYGEKISIARPTGNVTSGSSMSATNWRTPSNGHLEVSMSETPSEKRNGREAGSPAVASGRGAEAFNADKFHEDISNVLKELRQSLDIDAAFERMIAHSVPSERQAAEVADFIAVICEMSQAEARVAAFKLMVNLFLKGSWQKRAVTEGLEIFFGEMFTELKIDLPNLPYIVCNELALALGGLVDAGLLSQRFREELLNIE